MAQERQHITAGLDAIAGTARRAGERGPPPVHLWDPPFCGDLDLRIASDGTWYYLKTPIGRPALVKLFASVLKREGERYYLVTPVEKCGISVDDAPFLAVELRVARGQVGDVRDVPAGDVAGDYVSTHALQGGWAEDVGQVLHFRTNVDDWVACGPAHALRFEPEPLTGGLKPYLHVRRGLWAKVTRALFYDLVELGEQRELDGVAMFGVASGDAFFAMAPAESFKDYA